MLTPGRNPSLREVLDYYTRPDFLTFMRNWLGRYPVVAVIPQKKHWEPNWQKDAVEADTVETLRSFIVQKITQAYPDVDLDERPPYYPSFHQSVCQRARAGNAVPERMRLNDCVFEADLATWRESFMDIEPLLSTMDRFNVRYRHKFSGHRSLHMILPGDILPEGYRMNAAHKLAILLLRWSGAQAHPLPHITRMPYSLNEDTGLACLPIPHGGLAAFRPWQANLHVVEVQQDPWPGSFSPQDRDNVLEFIRALKAGELEPPDARYYPPDRVRIGHACLAAGKRLAETGNGSGASNQAIELLTSAKPISEENLLQRLEEADEDTRWLTLEAYLLNGNSLSQAAMVKILGQSDEYTRTAGVDVLLRFEDETMPILVSLFSGELRHYSTLSARIITLLAVSETLRVKVLHALSQDGTDSHDALILAACLTGAMTGNWKHANQLMVTIREEGSLSQGNRTHLEALEMMSSLGGWDKEKSTQVVHRLTKLGPEVTDMLLFAAGSPNRLFRRDIVTALAELADPRAIDLMILALGDDYTLVRRKAIHGLIKIGGPALDALLEAVDSDQAKIRRYALVCLKYINARQGSASRGKQAILDALGDGDKAVQRQAVHALESTLAREDLEQLQTILPKLAWENARELAVMIVNLGEEGIRLLERLALEAHNPAAAYAIARQGDERGRKILLRMLTSEDRSLKNTAVEMLRELKDEACIAYIAGQLQTMTDWYAAFLAEELGKIGTPQAVDALIRALDADFRLTRRGAVRGLAHAFDPRAIEPLIRCLSDPDSKVRKLASETLIQFGEPAFTQLQRVLENSGSLEKINCNLVYFILGKLGDAGKGQV